MRSLVFQRIEAHLHCGTLQIMTLGYGPAQCGVLNRRKKVIGCIINHFEDPSHMSLMSYVIFPALLGLVVEGAMFHPGGNGMTSPSHQRMASFLRHESEAYYFHVNPGI